MILEDGGVGFVGVWGGVVTATQPRHNPITPHRNRTIYSSKRNKLLYNQENKIYTLSQHQRNRRIKLTTIAYKDGILASDGLISNNQGIVSGKMCKVAEGRTIIGGAAGTLGDVVAFLEWVKKHDGSLQKRPKFEGGLSGLIIYSDGSLFFIDDNFTAAPAGVKIAALGSGIELALGAMAAGASAEQAVAIACELDTNSAQPVSFVSLKGLDK